MHFVGDDLNVHVYDYNTYILLALPFTTLPPLNYEVGVLASLASKYLTDTRKSIPKVQCEYCQW